MELLERSCADLKLVSAIIFGERKETSKLSRSKIDRR
jgi:hypothetical protein